MKKRTNKTQNRLIKTDKILKKICKVKNWYHQIEVAPGIITPGVNKSAEVLKLLNLPTDCHGLRALDLGTRDGYFAFELEKRGAQVIAIDYLPKSTTGFTIAQKILASKNVRYKQDNLYNITPEKYGSFDIVLFLGLLYHLPDPIRALRIVRQLCKGTMYIETQGIDNAFLLPSGEFSTLKKFLPILSDIPIMQFYPKNVLNNDYSNYWAPNMICLIKMLEETNFIVTNKIIHGNRLIAKCQTNQDRNLKYYMDIATGEILPKSS